MRSSQNPLFKGVTDPSLRSGFRLRAPASLTPAKRLKLAGFQRATMPEAVRGWRDGFARPKPRCCHSYPIRNENSVTADTVECDAVCRIGEQEQTTEDTEEARRSRLKSVSAISWCERRGDSSRRTLRVLAQNDKREE